MGRHDLSYRLFFSFRRMIQDLLQKIIAEPWVELIDFDSAELVNTSFVSAGHESRDSDIVWKLRRKDGQEPAIYILVEFQSRPDPSMPVRFSCYESLFYQNLLAGLPSSSWRELPLIIGILIYNGEEAWNIATNLGSLIAVPHPTAEVYRPLWPYLLVSLVSYDREALAGMNSPLADLFFIETSRDWSDVLVGVRRLQKNTSPEEGALRRACATWLRRVILPRFGLSPEDADLSLEEVETMLAERIDRWNSQIREEGRQEGRLEGETLVVLRQLRLKFGPLTPEVEEQVRSADAGRLLSWSERVLSAERLQDVFEGSE